MSTEKYFLPYNRKLVEKAKELRKNLTLAEKTIWVNYLQTFKYKILRQRPIDNFIVDFYCPQLKLVIEIDGDTHFTAEAQEYDLRRTKILEGYGLTLIRFTNDEVLQNLDAVCEQIANMIRTYPP